MFLIKGLLLGNINTSRGGKEVSLRSHNPKVVSSNLTRNPKIFPFPFSCFSRNLYNCIIKNVIVYNHLLCINININNGIYKNNCMYIDLFNSKSNRHLFSFCINKSIKSSFLDKNDWLSVQHSSASIIGLFG